MPMLHKTILIVDDEPDLREVLRLQLEMNGYGVLEAGSGCEALERLAQQSVDLVITDIRMPRMNGIELIEAIRQRQSHQPVIFVLTGHAQDAEAEILAKGANAVVSKPFCGDELLAMVASALGETELQAAPLRRVFASERFFEDRAASPLLRPRYATL